MLGSLETAPVAWDVLPRERERGRGGADEMNGGGDGVIMRVKRKRRSAVERRKSQELGWTIQAESKMKKREIFAGGLLSMPTLQPLLFPPNSNRNYN